MIVMVINEDQPIGYPDNRCLRVEAIPDYIKQTVIAGLAAWV